MRARQWARGRSFHELLEATDGDPELLAYVLRDELRRGRIEYHSTSPLYVLNGGIPGREGGAPGSRALLRE